MKISQLIKDLERVLENEGDVKVVVRDTDDNYIYALLVEIENHESSGGSRRAVIAEREYNGN